MSPEQVADTLSVDRRTVYRWLKSGELPANQIGRTWRIRGEEIKKKLNG
jgi:excisionase family DNA binding protein